MDKMAELEMAIRHIREGQAHVGRQMTIVEDLRRDGHPTIGAEELLKTFQDTLKAHRDHCQLLLKEIGEDAQIAERRPAGSHETEV